MKKIFLLMMSALLVLTFCSCNESYDTNVSSDSQSSPNEPEVDSDAPRTLNISTGEGYIVEYNGDSYERLVEVSYPVIKLTDEDEYEFAELQKSFDTLSDNKRNDQKALLEENKEYAIDFLENTEPGKAAFFSNITPYVRRADTLVTSILTYTYTYFGGAHGNMYCFGRNYDTQTGKELKLSDVVTDTGKLVDAVKEQLDKFYPDIDYEMFSDLEDVFGDETQIAWTLDYNGITFHFYPYTLTYFAAGSQTVTLSNEEYPDILKKEYQVLPISYGVKLVRGQSFYFDINDDGLVDELIFSYLENEYGNDSFLSVSVNGKECKSDYMLYKADAYFVHSATGKNYVYAEIMGDSDYTETVCFEVSDEAKEIGTVPGGMKLLIDYNNSECGYLTEVLTNPDEFAIETSTMILSTVSGYKNYYVSESGLPKTDDLLYGFSDERILQLRLLKDLEVDVYDEQSGSVKGTKVLKNGDTVLYYATDNLKYAYLKCSDGTKCRVECGHDSMFNFKVNGFSVDEIFDGIVFAG